MLPLSAATPPVTAEEFAQALTKGLAANGVTARSIQAEGASASQVARLSVDLTEARFSRQMKRPAVVTTASEPTLIDRLEVVATRIYFETTPLSLNLEAEQVAGRIAVGEEGALILESAKSGQVTLQTTQVALEALIQSLAKEAAAKQGFEVKKTVLTLTQDGPRAVGFKAEVTAKVFVMSATLALSGQLTIDDELSARFANLKLGGDSMVVSLAGSYIRPHLDKLEGRVFPLLAYTAGGLKLRDIELQAEGGLEVHARFGSEG